MEQHNGHGKEPVAKSSSKADIDNGFELTVEAIDVTKVSSVKLLRGPFSWGFPPLASKSKASVG